jgi:cation:H+ antiporter
MNILLGFLWLIASLFVLVKSADYFTEYSEKLGKILNIPNFIIGITIVALGTSLPEFASSLAAVLKGASEIVAANVIGSNVANVLLVIGLSAVFAKTVLESEKKINNDSAVLLLGATALISLVVYDLRITFIEAVFLLLCYIVYIYHSLSEKNEDFIEDRKIREKISWKIPTIILASCFFIYLGAEQTIDSLIYLSTLLGISEAIITLTVVALGTSLPEVLVSVSAARRGSYDIAMGNIIGSNMFNILVIPGILGLISTLSISPETISTGLVFLIISTIIFIISLFDNRISKGEGLIFLLLYSFFVYSLFI